MPLFLTNSTVFLYFLLYVTLATNYYLLNGNRDSRITLFFCVLLFIINFFFQSYTFGFSPDKLIYELKYQKFEIYETVATFGLGYGLYVFYYVLNFFNVEPPNLVFYYSFILNLLLLLFCLKKTFRNESFLLMFIFSMSWFVFDMFTNSIRQGVSSLFFLFFIMNMLSGHKVKSIGYAFLCFIFHWSAFVPIIISLVLHKTPNLSNRKSTFIYVLISCFFWLTLITPTYSLGSVVFYFSDLINSPFLTLKVNSYFSGHGIHTMSLFNRISLFYEPLLFSLIITFSFLTFYNKPKLKHEAFLINTFFALILYSVLNVSMEHAYRNFYWAQILIPLIVIQLISSVKNRVTGELRTFYLFVVTIVIVISSLGMWRSGILYLLYN